MSTQQANPSLKRFTASLDGEILVCTAGASACFVLGGATWMIRQISPGSPDLSGLIVPGLLYSLMGIARVPPLLRSQKAIRLAEVSAQRDSEDKIDTTQNIVAGQIESLQSEASAA